MRYYVFFSGNGDKDTYWGDYSNESEAQRARRFLLRDDTVDSVLVEYRKVSK